MLVPVVFFLPLRGLYDYIIITLLILISPFAKEIHPMINICIACKCADDREAIAALLGKHDDFCIVCKVEDGFDVIKTAIAKQPDVIILDSSLKDIESPALAPIVKRNSPSTALIVLCSQEDQVSVEASLKAGISGYIVRQKGFDNLAASVRSVYYGGLYITVPVRGEALNSLAVYAASREMKRWAFSAFTPTELGIFSGITHGYTDKEIALHLNISTGTLRNYVNRVKKKSGLKNRTQVTIQALLTGMIRLENCSPEAAGRFSTGAGLQPCSGYHAPLRHGASSR